jgi:hypothetical protein
MHQFLKLAFEIIVLGATIIAFGSSVFVALMKEKDFNSLDPPIFRRGGLGRTLSPIGGHTTDPTEKISFYKHVYWWGLGVALFIATAFLTVGSLAFTFVASVYYSTFSKRPPLPTGMRVTTRRIFLFSQRPGLFNTKSAATLRVRGASSIPFSLVFFRPNTPSHPYRPFLHHLSGSSVLECRRLRLPS